MSSITINARNLMPHLIVKITKGGGPQAYQAHRDQLVYPKYDDHSQPNETIREH